MKIVIYQCQPGISGAAENQARIINAAKRAGAVNADLLICPELMSSGYNVGAAAIRRDAQARDGAFAASIAAAAKRYRIAIAYGYPERDGDTLYNAAQLVNRDGEHALNYHKTHLFGDYERQIFAPGTSQCDVVDIAGWKIGLLICYDVEFPEAARLLALRGADLIAVPTALMHPYGRIPDVLIPARAYENQVYVAYANYCGDEGHLRYCGKSVIASPDGRALLQAHNDETLIIGELSLQDLAASRRLNTYLTDRRPETYRPLTQSGPADRK